MGPNPHEQQAARTEHRRKTRELNRPHGRQVSERSRRAAVFVLVVLVIAIVAALIIGWLNLEWLR